MYLREHQLYAKDTLADSAHPNALGNFLIRKLIAPSLRYDPEFPQDAWKDLVRETLATDPRLAPGPGGVLKLAFDGNRIDVIAQHGGEAKRGTARVLVGGKPPSQFPELYCHGRPTAAPHVWWPAINQFGHDQPLVVESWTLKFSECDVEEKAIRFAVSGSVTGADGEGSASQRFVSSSRRVTIEPSAWSVLGALQYAKKPLPPDYVITWETKPLFVDTCQAPATPDASREYPTALAQGLTNGPHTLEPSPTGDGPVPVAGFRVYKPPLR